MARHSADPRPVPPAWARADRDRTEDTVRIHPPDEREPAPRADRVLSGPTGQRSGARPNAALRFVGWLGSLVLLAVVALAGAVAVVPAATGSAVLTVLSPSMTPTYPVGTLVVVRPRPVDGIRIGDVVSFVDRDPATGEVRTVTHRVVGVDPGPRFRTKGDANADADPDAVEPTEVRGVVWYALPRVGGWGTALRSGPGLLVAGGAVLLLVALMLLVPRRGR